MLSDEEILKRIAEIEGKTGGEIIWRKDGSIALCRWNPIHDWGDLGPLIEKYKLSIECFAIPENGWFWRIDDETEDQSLPHAILLAIIEAHDEKQVG